MMNFAVFETAIGRCGIVWSEHGIAGVQLPERSEAATRKRMLRRFPAARESAPPHAVRPVAPGHGWAAALTAH
jgi:methylated-DNA-[protein]-cysteine S-methyltransferase